MGCSEVCVQHHLRAGQRLVRTSKLRYLGRRLLGQRHLCLRGLVRVDRLRQHVPKRGVVDLVGLVAGPQQQGRVPCSGSATITCSSGISTRYSPRASIAGHDDRHVLHVAGARRRVVRAFPKQPLSRLTASGLRVLLLSLIHI